VGSDDGPDRVPDEVVQRAKDAFRSRARFEVVACVSDSADAGDGSDERQLRFEGASLTVEVAVRAVGDRRDLRGSIGPRQLDVELDVERSTVAASEQGGGTFAFRGVPRGVVRLRLLERDRGAVAVTEWFRL
jgi:hypothetical protein